MSSLFLRQFHDPRPTFPVPIILQRGDFAKIKFGRAIVSSTKSAGPIHLIAGGFKLPATKLLEPAFENFDPDPLPGFRIAAAEQLMDHNTMRLPGNAKFAELANDETIGLKLLANGIGNQDLGAQIFI